MAMYQLSEVEKVRMQIVGNQGPRSSFLPQICFSIWIVGTFLLAKLMIWGVVVVCVSFAGPHTIQLLIAMRGL